MKKSIVILGTLSFAISLSAMASCYVDQQQMEAQIAQYGSISTQSHTVNPAPNIDSVDVPPSDAPVCQSIGYVGNNMRFFLTWENGNWGNTLFADFYSKK